MKKVVYKKGATKRPIKTIANKKEPSKINKRHIYRIVWRDAFSEPDEWHDSQTISTEEYLCETTGYLITESKNKNYYTIASTITCDDNFCSLINIPKSMVVTKQKLTTGT